MATIAKLMVEIGANNSGLINALSESEKRMDSVGKSVTKAGAKMTAGITLPIAGVGAAIIKTGAEFESAMDGVTSLMSQGEKDAEKQTNAMHDLAIAMGEKTAFGAVDAAKGIEELIKAGVKVEDIMAGGLQGALDLAIAGEIGLADAAEIASTALNAFKDDGNTVTSAANILAGAANASATSVGELKFGLAAVSAVAAGVGQTFEGTTTALAVLAQNGLKGSDAGTSLKTMLANLQPRTDDATAAFMDLGIIMADGTNQFINANGSFKSMAEVAGILQSSMSGLTDAQRQQYLYTMFGSDAIRAANILYKEGEAGVNAMNAAMSNTTAADVARERMDNLKGKMEELKGSLETMAVKLYEANDGALKGLVDKLQSIVNWFGSLDASTQQTIIVIALIVAAIGPLLMILGMMAQGLSVVAGLFAFIVSPIGLVIVAIGLLVAAFLWLYTTNEEFKNTVTALWEGIKTMFETTIQAIVDFAKPIIEDMVKFFTKEFKDFKEFWDEMWPKIKQMFENIWNGIMLFIQPFLSTLEGVFKGMMKTVEGLLQTGWDVVKGIFQASVDILQGIIKVFVGVLTLDWQTAWDGLKDIVVGVWNGIETVVKGSINVLISMINGITTAFSSIKIKIPKVDIPLIGEVGGGEIGFPSIPKIPMLETGTNYFPRDGMAYLHEGESVVPKRYNPAAGGVGSGSGEQPIIIYLGNEKIYDGFDNYLGGKMTSLGAI